MSDLRPVEVKDVGRGIFHRWHEFRYVTPPSVMVGGGAVVQWCSIYGVVELEDGSVRLVRTKDIRFCDTAEKMDKLFKKEEKT